MSTNANMNLNELEKAVLSVIPELSSFKGHKGTCGRVGVIGGSREYTGAPFFSARSSLLVGADMAHIFCDHSAATAIKSFGPDIIVHPALCSSLSIADEEKKDEISKKIEDDVSSWFPRLHVLVVGPGLGRDPFVQHVTRLLIQKAKANQLPIVIDGDGIELVMQDTSLISGYAKVVLTPNKNEFERLSKKLNTRSPQELAKELGVTVVEKGEHDVITDGVTSLECQEQGGPRRVAGQGDILTGCIGTFLVWSKDYKGPVQPTLLAAYAACRVVKRANQLAFAKYGRAMTTMNMLDAIGQSFVQLYDSKL